MLNSKNTFNYKSILRGFTLYNYRKIIYFIDTTRNNNSSS